MEISSERYAQKLEYLIALQRAIEYHCAGHFIPLEISINCPHHAALLNNYKEKIISERVAAQLTDEADVPACRWGHHYENENGRPFSFCPDCGRRLS